MLEFTSGIDDFVVKMRVRFDPLVGDKITPRNGALLAACIAAEAVNQRFKDVPDLPGVTAK